MKARIPLDVVHGVEAEAFQAVLLSRLMRPSLSIPAYLEVDVSRNLARAFAGADLIGRMVLQLHHHDGVPFLLLTLRLCMRQNKMEPVGLFDLWMRSEDQLKPAFAAALAETKRTPFSVESYVHPEWRGAGLGTEIYAAFARMVAPVHGMIIPDAWTGSTTSEMARAVWQKLAVRGDLRCLRTPFGFVYGCWAVSG